MIRPLSVEWKTTVVVAGTDVIDVGAPGSAVTIADCRGFSFFRWQAWWNASGGASAATRLTVEVALNATGFAELVPPGVNRYQTLFTHDIAEGALASTYNMTGVYLGNPGWITLQWPYVRIKLTNLEVIEPQTEIDFYAIAWG